MVATMSVMSVVAAVMAAVMVTAIGTALSSNRAVKCHSLPPHLQGIGPQYASVSNAYGSHFNRVADAGQKPLILKKLCGAQADF